MIRAIVFAALGVTDVILYATLGSWLFLAGAATAGLAFGLAIADAS